MDLLTLLNPQDPNPVRETLVAGERSPFLLVGDHAGSAIPAALGDLGLSAADRGRHIALDIGVEALGIALSERLDAPFIRQAYSRLVVDCNRHPSDTDWIPVTSDGTPIPGNADLSETARSARHDAIFEPYHHAIEAVLDRRTSAGRETVLVALHSFTPVMRGEPRPWEIGVLHDGHDDDFALAALALLRERAGRTVGDNRPYVMDETDYTVPRHAYPRGLRYLELEVRQDLLVDADGVAAIADVLAEIFPASL